MSDKHLAHYNGGVTDENFIGREVPMADLQRFADHRGTTHLAIYGLPHVGKTSLLKEWIRRMTEDEYHTQGGVPVIILEQTVNVNDETKDSSFRYLLRRFLHISWRQLRLSIREGRLPENDEELNSFDEKIKTMANNPPEDLQEMLDLLRAFIACVSAHGVRTLMILDEFERAGQCWSEDHYVRFTELLMDRSLNLRCVVASRPHISYVVTDYVRKITPFEPYCLRPFDDRAMELCMQAIVDDGGPDLRLPENEYMLQQVLYCCGRNPFLLTMMGLSLIEHPDMTPMELYFANKETYFSHFKDVVSFMLYEEEKEAKSFTHIVKCYFGTSDEYADMISTYIDLGYICLEPADSKYTYREDRYMCQDETGYCHYYTVSSAFVSYLYCNCLEHVSDVRDILTGLVHSLRDIIRDELSQYYDGYDWNIELLRRLKADHGLKDGYSGTKVVLLYPDNHWYATSEAQVHEDYPYYPNGCYDLCNQLDWTIDNPQELIRIADTSITYAVNAVNKGVNTVMPVLDPINLLDTVSILIHYDMLFDKYFVEDGVMIPHADLQAMFKIIHTNRNEIAHFSRYGLTEQEITECKKLCIRLLKSIYTCIDAWRY